MNSFFVSLLAIAGALGCGLMAGTFFAFSNFVMRALARIPAAQGVAAMQSINVVVLNPVFLGVFLGTAAVCAMVSVASVVNWSRPGSGWLLVGGVLYLAGNLVITRVCNIPRNDALAALDPTSVQAAQYWTDYLANWTTWNHVRTLTGLAAMATLIVGAILSRSAT